MKLKIGIATLVCGALVSTLVGQPSAAPRQELSVYHYCVLAKRPYGDPTFYSTVFQVRRDEIVEGVQNAFNSYVAARQDPDAMSGAICMGPFDGYQQAADSENDMIGRDRRAGRNVVLTRWAFHGD